jgi:uncharacterized cupin superfamily protein
MSRSLVTATAASAELKPNPIPADWILSGSPTANATKVVTSHDTTSYVAVWDCTEGRFNWHYTQDEVVVVMSGEVFVTNEAGEEYRLGPGDVAFFPAGTSFTWNVTKRIRKVAVLRQTMPRPAGFCVRAWNKFLRVAGLAGQSPLLVGLVLGLMV